MTGMETVKTKRCVECGNDGPTPFCKGLCRKCYQNALRREKKGDGPQPAKARKQPSAKANGPDAMTFLRTRCKAAFDAAVAKAQAEYDKAMEAVEIVAALAKDD